MDPDLARDLQELWDRAPGWAARCRQSPHALPASLRRASEEGRPDARSRAPEAVLLKLDSGDDLRVSFLPDRGERRALVQGTIELRWNGSLAARFALEAGLGGAASLRVAGEALVSPGPWREALGRLLEEARRLDDESREGRDEWRRMRTRAARGHLPEDGGA